MYCVPNSDIHDKKIDSPKINKKIQNQKQDELLAHQKILSHLSVLEFMPMFTLPFQIQW